MKKTIKNPVTEKITLSVDNAGEIIISAAEGEELEITLEYTDERLEWKEVKAEDEYKLHIKNPDGNKSLFSQKSHRTFPSSSPSSSTPLSPLQMLGDIISLAGMLAPQTNFPLVKVTLYIPEGVNKLKLDMNNSTVNYRSGRVTKLKTDFNNCKLKISEDLIISDCVFDMNNSKISLPYPGFSGNVSVTANNSKIKFSRGNFSEFPVLLSGNHLSAENGFRKSINAPVAIEGNNIKVKFTKKETTI